MPNEEIKEIAKKVLKKSDILSEEEFGIDPITIIMVVAIIVNIIRVIQECHKDEHKLFDTKDYSKYLKNKIIEMARKKSIMNTMRLKRILRKHLTKENYTKYANKLINGIMQSGVELSEKEIYSLLEFLND